MAPIASGTLPPSTLIHSFLNWKSLVAIVVGVVVSWLGGRGVTLMGSQPQLVAGLLVGTVLGVALFRGVPVGPLIAAGLVSLIVGRQYTPTVAPPAARSALRPGPVRPE